MAKRRGEKAQKRVRYMMMGNAILAGEHAPVHITAKTRFKNAPKSDAIANWNDLDELFTGVVVGGQITYFNEIHPKLFELGQESENQRIKRKKLVPITRKENAERIVKMMRGE